MTNEELWDCTNTVESRSRLDDVFETIERLHHRIVTEAQLDLQLKKERAQDAMDDSICLMLAENPQLDFCVAYEMVTLDVIRYIEKERRNTHDFIEKMESHMRRMKAKAVQNLKNEPMEDDAVDRCFNELIRA